MLEAMQKQNLELWHKIWEEMCLKRVTDKLKILVENLGRRLVFKPQ